MPHFVHTHAVAAAALSFEDETKYVAVITAAATAAMTWVEYKNHGQKLMMFTTAVNALQLRIMWWDSLRPAEKTPAQIAELVQTSEQIILEARPLGKLSLHELEGTAASKADIAAGNTAATDKAATTSEDR